MKCSKCGFIFNGEKDTCPYCGTKINDAPLNFLHSSTAITPNTSIKNISIICIVLVNLLAIAFFVDWSLGFTYKLTLFSYVLFIGLLTALVIMYKRRTSLSTFISIDLFLIFLIFLAAMFGNFPSINLTGFFAGVVFPSYMMLSSLCMGLVYVVSKKKTFSPVGLISLLVLKLLIGITLFVLGMIFASSGGAKLAFFDLSNVFPGVDSILVVKVLTLGAFAVTLLMLINTLVLLFYRIANNIRKFYGNKE